MKSTLLILSLFLCLVIRAQNTYEHSPGMQGGSYISDHLLSAAFFQGHLTGDGETSYFQTIEKTNFSDYPFFAQPLPPLLTTSPVDLEICTGNSTRLTANSKHLIYWYTTPPPIGTPVGTGPVYNTPALTTGYYTFYAIADNDGIKSDISAMEVVMVYPSPTISILSNVNSLCANETATLTATGTTYYEWENGPVSSQMTIRPKNTESYRVTGINTAGCKSTAVYTQTVETCDIPGAQANTSNNKTTAISSQLAEDRFFSVFPNPNNGEFNIRVSSISESTRIEIYNGLGQLAYRFKVSDELTAVTLKDSPNGIYIVRIIENDTVLKQQKVVKE